MTTITLDTREHELIALCTEQKIAIQTANLEVGDILLHHPVHGETLVMERKTLADLAASIKDGRFREQKQRILSAHPNHRVTYLIEGVTLNKLSTGKELYGMSTSALYSAMISLSYRDGFHLIQTGTIKDTLSWILEVASRMDTHPDKIKYTIKDGDETSYLASVKVKTKKIENVTPTVCYTLQLGQVPGISTKLAGDIIVMYPTLFGLLNAIKEHGVKAFKDVPGIGAKKAQGLVEYLMPGV